MSWMTDLFPETVDDRVDSIEFFLKFAYATLVRLVAVTELVTLAPRTLVRLRYLTHLTLDRVQAPTHRLQHTHVKPR